MTQWLACKVTPGILSNELAVVIETSRGDLSFFVPGGQVIVSAEPTQDAPVDGRVAVVVWDQDEYNSLVALPAEAMEGSRFATVSRRLLMAA
jgi:hypothetical protein